MSAEDSEQGVPEVGWPSVAGEGEDVCSGCGGSGKAEGGDTCPVCGGSGRETIKIAGG